MSTAGVLTGEARRQVNLLLGPWVRAYAFHNLRPADSHVIAQLVGCSLDLLLQGTLLIQVRMLMHRPMCVH